MTDTFEIGDIRNQDKQVLSDVAHMKAIVQSVRAVRNSKNIAQKETLQLQVLGEFILGRYEELIKKMANLESIAVVGEKSSNAVPFMVGAHEYFVLLEGQIDVDAEREKAQAELSRLEGFLAGIEKKLSNERFVSGAPEAVVALERKKKADTLEKIEALKKSIEALQ